MLAQRPVPASEALGILVPADPPLRGRTHLWLVSPPVPQVRRRRRFTTALALLVGILLSPMAARAQATTSTSPADPPSPEARGSIYRLHLLADTAIIAAGVFGTTVPFLLSSGVVDTRCPCNPENLNALDRTAVHNHSDTARILGDVLVGVAVVTPAVYELVTVRPMTTTLEDLVVLTEVMAVNGGLVTLAKFAVQRPIPRAYAGDPEFIDVPGGYLSFYSGHTSFAFAALSFGAVTIGVRHQQYVWPWVVTVLSGGAVATAMVLGGVHFPSDVAMGALAGTVVGVGVPLLHLRKHAATPLALGPGPGGAGLSLRGRF
jgi:membrane-associated phospholipid phosphatase